MNICNYYLITFNIPKTSCYVKKRRMKHLANSYKKQREFENLEISANSFYVNLFSTATEINKGNVTTNFTFVLDQNQKFLLNQSFQNFKIVV